MLRVTPREVGNERPDIFVGAIGYEERCTHALTSLRGRRGSFMFAYQELNDSFQDRIDDAEKLGAKIIHAATDREFALGFDLLLQETRTRSLHRLGIDISSMGRRRIAHVLTSLSRDKVLREGTTVEFYYSPAEFREPTEPSSSSLVADPVSPRFKGTLRSLSLPVAAVIGLGYEPFRAIGVLELLEPAQTWAFFPDSEDGQYELALLRANHLLWNSIGENDLLDYPVLRPAETYKRLESLVIGASRSFRLALVPMGPKIFAVSCMLVALDPRIPAPAVWRVGERSGSEALEVVARGPVVGLSVLVEMSQAVDPELSLVS